MREVEHRTHPAAAARDVDHVVSRAELTHTAHHLDAERHGAVLLLEPRTQLAELLAHRVERVLARAAEQEAGVEDDDLGARRLCDAGGVVEHSDRHVQLLAALGVAHEAGDRSVHREDDARVACELAEVRGEVVVHPEASLEVDLARAVAPLLQRRDRRLGRLLRRHARRPEADLAHAPERNPLECLMPSDVIPTLRS